MLAAELKKSPILNNDKLHPEFLRWWYSPWNHRHMKKNIGEYIDIVAMRDRYVLWCADRNIPPELPGKYDSSWCKLHTLSRNSLLKTIKLFSGLISAQKGNIFSYGQLSHEDKKWCISISATQPAKNTPTPPIPDVDSHYYLFQGIAEIQRHLDSGFPGLWPRLKLVLTDDNFEEDELWHDKLQGFSHGPNDNNAFSYQRALRCWKICQQRIESGYQRI